MYPRNVREEVNRESSYQREICEDGEDDRACPGALGTVDLVD